MEALLPILICFIVFSTPVAILFTLRYFRLKEKQLEYQSKNGRELEAREKKILELEGRIENLESILIETDGLPRGALAGRSEKPALPAATTSDAGHALPGPRSGSDDK